MFAVGAPCLGGPNTRRTIRSKDGGFSRVQEPKTVGHRGSPHTLALPKDAARAVSTSRRLRSRPRPRCPLDASRLRGGGTDRCLPNGAPASAGFGRTGGQTRRLRCTATSEGGFAVVRIPAA